MKLILVRGVPGSGKSTFCAKALGGAFHVENDMFHVRDGEYRFDAKRQKDAVSWCMDTARCALAAGMDVAVSNTFTKRRYVEAYRKIAEEAGAAFEVYKMTGSFENEHRVPEEVKRGMADGFEGWDGETFVYPNLNQDPSDPYYRPYMATKLKVGDRVLASRWKGGRDTAAPGETVEHEDAEAVVTEIRQGSYDYLNVFFKFVDTGKEGLAMSGDLKKVED